VISKAGMAFHLSRADLDAKFTTMLKTPTKQNNFRTQIFVSGFFFEIDQKQIIGT
jgi:small basic protein